MHAVHIHIFCRMDTLRVSSQEETQLLPGAVCILLHLYLQSPSKKMSGILENTPKEAKKLFRFCFAGSQSNFRHAAQLAPSSLDGHQ